VLLPVQRFHIEQSITPFARACKDDRRWRTADRRAFARACKVSAFALPIRAT
jgi:hypothetical protein